MMVFGSALSESSASRYWASAAARPVADGVEAGVGAERPDEPGVIVPLRAEMKLRFTPASLGVELAEIDHHEPGERFRFSLRGGLAFAGGVEDLAEPFSPAQCGRAEGKPMVGKAATEFVKSLMPACRSRRETR